MPLPEAMMSLFLWSTDNGIKRWQSAGDSIAFWASHTFLLTLRKQVPSIYTASYFHNATCTFMTVVPTLHLVISTFKKHCPG